MESESCSTMMTLAEVYSITYEGPEDNIQGVIQVLDADNDYQILFKNMDKNNDEIRTSEQEEEVKKVRSDKKRNRFEVVLQGPTKSSISAEHLFQLEFYLFRDLYICMTDPLLLAPIRKYSTPLCQNLMTSDGNHLLKVYYGIFEDAAEARVKVKLTNVKSAADVYGCIYAWTSEITDPLYKSMLFNKDIGELDVKPGFDLDIPLSRSLVAVPLQSDLILEIFMSGGNDSTVEVFECFKNGPNVSRNISCSNWDIQVEIIWRYEFPDWPEDRLGKPWQPPYKKIEAPWLLEKFEAQEGTSGAASSD